MFQIKANMTPFSQAVDPSHVPVLHLVVPAAPLPQGDQFDSHGSQHKNSILFDHQTLVVSRSHQTTRGSHYSCSRR